MNFTIRSLGTAMIAFSIAISSAYAGKPKDNNGTYLGNGFPSGEHFNLLLHGKKADHICDTFIELVEITPNDGALIEDAPYAVGDEFPEGECPDASVDYTYRCEYDNVVNMPRGSDSIQILMESGRNGPAKKNSGQSDLNNATLQVTDACTGYTANDPAIVRLPGNDQGYAVYGRVLGKPTSEGSPDFSVDGRTIPVYGDIEDGNAIWLIGVIDENNVYTPSECDLDGCTLNRWDPETKGKGALKATDMTGLFQFKGTVCYQSENDEACANDGCTETPFCCAVVDSYQLGDINYLDYNGEVYECTPQQFDGDEPIDCALGDYPQQINLYCHEFTEETWIFNIADFVNVFYNLSSDAYNVQIRFYPLPLN